MLRYLILEDVMGLHEDILRNSQEDKGLAPDKSIASALYRIDNHIIYDDLIDPYEIAALYGIAIAKGHCFNNGNKRTALVSMLTFLLLNDISVEISDDLIEEIMVDIATDKMTKEDLSEWLKKYSKLC